MEFEHTADRLRVRRAAHLATLPLYAGHCGVTVSGPLYLHGPRYSYGPISISHYSSRFTTSLSQEPTSEIRHKNNNKRVYASIKFKFRVVRYVQVFRFKFRVLRYVQVFEYM